MFIFCKQSQIFIGRKYIGGMGNSRKNQGMGGEGWGRNLKKMYTP